METNDNALGRDIVDIGEYSAILEDVGNLNSRRQTATNVFVSLNAVFLTSFGFLLASSSLKSLWATVASLIITLVVIPINRTWLITIDAYTDLIAIRYQCLYKMEQNSLFVGKLIVTADSWIRGEGKKKRPRIYTPLGGSTGKIEKNLARYFLILYPLITLSLGIFSILISNHLLPDISLFR